MVFVPYVPRIVRLNFITGQNIHPCTPLAEPEKQTCPKKTRGQTTSMHRARLSLGELASPQKFASFSSGKVYDTPFEILNQTVFDFFGILEKIFRFAFYLPGYLRERRGFFSPP
jgi:hypothetical protein